MSEVVHDIVVRATVSSVYAYPLTQKATEAGFQSQSCREEYSDQLRRSVREFAAAHNLSVDWSRDW